MSEEKSIREIAKECENCTVKPISYDKAEDFAQRTYEEMDRMDIEGMHRTGVSISACEEHDPIFYKKCDSVVK